ncbi:MAG TPA: class I SAM-dependent methyltransferase [Thermoanaerobaculia bacterium]|nr:class I SAM-dependent methyltransferase [Thermoanaerobaculia bacterium]
MTLAYRTEENDPLVLAIGQGTAVCDGANLNVDARDEMFRFLLDSHAGERGQALSIYFHSGQLIWTTQKEIVEWRFGKVGRVGKLLDFASGYGRITRFLVRDLPPERVWVADIDADGVRFQEEQFGVHGIVSTAAPEDFACAERFDCILVSSLFSHLPEPTFLAWLAKICGLLAPGGMLVFSVHDEALLSDRRAMPASGIVFSEESESHSLAKSEYGSTWVSEAFVRSAVSRSAPGCSTARIPRGFCNFQDLYVVVEGTDPDFSGLTVSAKPEGFVYHCSWVPPDRLEIRGWVIDRVHGKVREVQALVEGRVLQRISDLTPREDFSREVRNEPVTAWGWHFSIPLPPDLPRSSGILVVQVVDGAGRESTLYSATIAGALLRSAQLDLVATTAGLQRMRGEKELLAWNLRDARHEAHVLEARIAAMEASFFWKVRNRWFALKRFLRLTDQP